MKIYQCPDCNLKCPMELNEFPFRCRCGFIANIPKDFTTFRSPHQRKRAREVAGVGVELVRLLLEIGASTKDCDACAVRAVQMNNWGPELCRQNIKIIEGWLKEAYKAATLKQIITVGLHGYFSITAIIEEAIQRFEKWSSPTYINLDRIGWGDLVLFSYIAEGTKNSKYPLIMCATGERARHVRMLGQEPADPILDSMPWSAFEAECNEGMVMGRLEFYANFYGVPNTPQKPTLTIPQEYTDWAATTGIDRNTVLFFPDSLAPNRVWPKIYWDMLVDLLAKAGLKSYAFPIRGIEKHKNALNVKPISKVVAAMRLAGLGIGNDSALINWTPIADLPALALMGPTRGPIFGHAPLIRPITPRTKLAYDGGEDCNGCCYHFKHNPHCQHVCMSLANMLPEEVAEEAIKYHKECWG